jgi:hypothetical protein
MRVLVCGGREFGNWECVRDALDSLDVETVIEGGARGADTHAWQWAALRGVRSETFQANWTAYGLHAGPKRNAQMLTEGKPDLVLAFPGGKGTANMIELARKAGVEVKEIACEEV